MLLATEVPPEVATWGAGVMVLGAVALLGFLVRRAFEGLESSLHGVGAKVDSLVVSHHATGTALALAQAQLAELRVEVASNRQRLHDLKDAWGPTLTRASMMGEQLRDLERQVREMAEGVAR